MNTTAAGAPGDSSDDQCWTMSVPAAGRKYFGLNRNGAYAAAARGDLPTVRIGRLLRVPIKAVERMLDTASQQPPSA